MNHRNSRFSALSHFPVWPMESMDQLLDSFETLRNRQVHAVQMPSVAANNHPFPKEKKVQSSRTLTIYQVKNSNPRVVCLFKTAGSKQCQKYLLHMKHVDVSKKIVVPAKSSILIGFFHYFHHPFLGFPPYFSETPHVKNAEKSTPSCHLKGGI